EVLNGAEYKPSGVCSHQAWSETMVLQPVIEGLLGIETDALKYSLNLSPQIPADWNTLKVERIKLGETSVNIEMNRLNGKTIFNFSTNSVKPVNVNFSPAFALNTGFGSIKINGKLVTASQANNSSANLSFVLNKSAIVEIVHSNGISVLPHIESPRPNDVSKGFRILHDKIEGNDYIVEVQGISGSKNEMKIYSSSNISGVENGILISSDGPVYTIGVEFEKSQSKYFNKNIKIKIGF
ncbi:MAG: hypothetical protein WC061_07930, partial [Melioribacteraceae bacterium]